MKFHIHSSSGACTTFFLKKIDNKTGITASRKGLFDNTVSTLVLDNDIKYVKKLFATNKLNQLPELSNWIEKIV